MFINDIEGLYWIIERNIRTYLQSRRKIFVDAFRVITDKFAH